MNADTFLFGWGLGLIYTSIMTITYMIQDFGIGAFIGIGIIGIVCLIINFVNQEKAE